MSRLFESLREFPRAKLLAAIHLYNKKNIDHRADQTKTEFMNEYRDLMSVLKFPLTVYRGFAAEITTATFDARESDFNEWRADREDLGRDDDVDELLEFYKTLNLRAVGTSWTWDKDAAVCGGVLQGADECHLLMVAQVESRHVDWTCTLWQNLTVYEEEKEVRLLPNTPIKIVGLNPALRPVPCRGNTGPESWDERANTLQDIQKMLVTMQESQSRKSPR